MADVFQSLLQQTREATRASRLRFLQGALLFTATAGGFLCGSPGPRCIVGALVAISSRCLTICSQWQRTAIVLAVFTIGPYSELASTYRELLVLGAASHHYSIMWFDALSFLMIGVISMPFFRTSRAVWSRPT